MEDVRRPVEIVQFENVGLIFHRPIFSEVNLSLFSGKFYFLTGDSGVGKTSFLRLMYRDLGPSTGCVRVFHRDLQTLKSSDLALFRQKIGLVFQDCQLLTHLNIVDNVALPLKILGTSVTKSRAYAKEILHWVGLEENFNHFPRTLSDGQKQRVGIARAIVTRPTLLLADEPTGNVEEATAYKLIFLFQELNKLGTTVVVATHNRSLMKAFVHTEINVRPGKISVAEPHHQKQAQYA